MSEEKRGPGRPPKTKYPFKDRQDPAGEQETEDQNPAREQEGEKSPESEQAPLRVMDTTQSHIHDRIKGQPKSLSEIKHIPPSEDRHRLSLPRELEAYTDKYAFYWIYKNNRLHLDYKMDERGWLLVNKTYFPDLPNHMFSAAGAIERGDCILGFMPIERAQRLRDEPGQRSSNAVKAQYEKHEGDPRYYTPTEGNERVQRI